MVDGELMIQAEGVYYNYKTAEHKEIPALRGVDLTIRKGEFIAIVGHNGSGKSTFAKMLNAILLPSMGQVLVLGMDTRDENLLFDIRQHVGMVFQNPDNQIVATVVEEDVAFAPENLGVPPAEIRRRVDESLAAVGMTKYAHHATYQLSGGQKQRVAIAGIVAMRPDCVIMDEPTAMLDPVGRREVMRTIRKLNQEFGITVVLITHHMDEAAQADRMAVLSDGVIVMDGTPRQIFSRAKELMALGLSVPQPVELAMLLREEGVDMPGNILTARECAEAIAKLLKNEARGKGLADNRS